MPNTPPDMPEARLAEAVTRLNKARQITRLRHLEGRADGRDRKIVTEVHAEADNAGAAVERKSGRRKWGS